MVKNVVDSRGVTERVPLKSCFSERDSSSVVWILSDNVKLANQIARLVASVPGKKLIGRTDSLPRFSMRSMWNRLDFKCFNFSMPRRNFNGSIKHFHKDNIGKNFP